ncbi:uncharacterized protein LOC136028555 [Artemia franciscana]|uniref:uncharacterized protein LOC136028555 n=1 Tax=Artemia franciscana TaxID=6661 RepID=UPI0032DA80CE
MSSSFRASTLDFYDLSNKNVKESYSVDFNRKRGHVLIVNVQVFTNSYVPTREGSEMDVLHLRSLFEDLKFTVLVKDNLNADDMRSAIKEFANRKDHTCSFVFILSHGTKSHGVDGKWEILCSDDKAVAIVEVMTILSNKEANHLSGKPRCIVVNICSEITCDRSAANPSPNRSAIKEFANRKDHTCSFVFILSRGTKSHGVDGKWEILCSDDKAVAIDEVMTILSNKEANHLSGKPRCIVVNIYSEITCDRSAANPSPNPVSNLVPNVCGSPSIRESNISVDDMTIAAFPYVDK